MQFTNSKHEILGQSYPQYNGPIFQIRHDGHGEGFVHEHIEPQGRPLQQPPAVGHQRQGLEQMTLNDRGKFLSQTKTMIPF